MIWPGSPAASLPSTGECRWSRASSSTAVVASPVPLFLDEAREHYASRLTGRGNRPLARVRVAQLGEAAAVVGAAELAREHALAL